MVKKVTTHTRIYEESLRWLRHINAETGEQQLDILDRLLSAEWKRIQTLAEKGIRLGRKKGEKANDVRNLPDSE